MKIVPTEQKTQLEVLLVIDNVSYITSNATEIKKIILLKEITSSEEKLFVISNFSKVELNKQVICVKFSTKSYALISGSLFFTLVFNNDDDTMLDFENVLKEKTNFSEKIKTEQKNEKNINEEISPQEKPVLIKIGNAVSDGIELSSDFISNTVIKGSSNLVGSGLVGAKNMYTYYTPKNENYQLPLPEVVKTTATEGEYVATKFNEASSEMMGALVSGLTHAAKSCYDAGTYVVNSIVGSDENAPPNEYTDTMLKIGGTTFSGIGNILSSVGYSVDKVVNDFSESSSGILSHSVGKDVGDVGKKSISITKNGTQCYLTLSGLNVKTLAISTAANTAGEIAKQ
eukprot:gene12361-6029_t